MAALPAREPPLRGIRKGELDAFVRKYDGNGKEIWTRQFGTEYDDYVIGVSVDGAGNIYVVGRTYGTLPGQEGKGDYDAFIVKFGPKPHPRMEDIIVLCAPHPVGKEGCVFSSRFPRMRSMPH